MYRSLMPLTKWHLMAIGQEIAAFQAVVASYDNNNNNNRHQHERMQSYLSSVTPFGMAIWLEGVQSAIYSSSPPDEEAHQVFCDWLKRALAAAMNFRSERCTVHYEIASTAKPPSANIVPVWTSKAIMQKVLHKQLAHWNERLNQSSTGGGDSGSGSSSNRGSSSHVLKDVGSEMEVVVTAALRSYGDLYVANPTDSTKMNYHRMQALAIQLMRKVFGQDRDAVVWSLSKEHKYFWGLCQIAHDHRKEVGEFDLIPLFSKFATDAELNSGLTFGKYVIKWHIDRNLIGEALQYGKQCESDLLLMMNSEASLRPHRWVVSIQRGDYESATTNLMESVDRGGSKISLKQAQFNLAMAKMTNKVVASKSVSRRGMAKDRNKKIENMRELTHVQEKLLTPHELQHCYPWTLGSLLGRALEKVDAVTEISEKAETLFLALVLCASMDDSNNSSVEAKKQAASEIWYKAVVADWDLLTSILDGSGQVMMMMNANMKQTVLTTSVFGKLVTLCDQCSKSSWEHVNIDSMMERIILDKFGSSADQSSMQRMLRLVLSQD
eukprot:CAMPEP_0198140850 /NCGR_PEP_ID=MMETSP1443-20131203/3935_1 /TAXON_ID=186043 /ORGANISM="Entomoneis sp., Strain CCMP2396" /LENGTH=550 /DNA_ID=CAMNT_0043803387 /DNA_START=1 /DNA_END=1656 /DNA_ORIENTATION=+